MQLSANSRLGFGELSVVAEDGEFIVGDPSAGVFLSVPEAGLVAVRELQRGGTIAEATATTSAHAGQEVDVLEFADVLLQAGLVREVDGHRLGASASPARRRRGPRREVVAPLFSVPAWLLYAGLFLGSVSVLAAAPDARPTFEDWFFYPNPAVSAAGALLTVVALAAGHELAHWLAARAAGVGARLQVGRRLFVLVFETDLSELWSLPRRRRYGPFLAGMAFNTVLLAVALGLRLAWTRGLIDLPPLVVRYLGALVLINVIGLLFQTLVFARTDLYAVLITALGCRNLSRVNFLRLKARIWRLDALEARELAEAHPRDLGVARWFGLLYAVGMAGAAWYFVQIFLPGTVVFAGWMFSSLAGAPPGTAAFWEALVVALVSASQAASPLAVFLRERLAARRLRA